MDYDPDNTIAKEIKNDGTMICQKFIFCNQCAGINKMSSKNIDVVGK